MCKLKIITAWILIVSFGLVGCATTGGHPTFSSPEACIAAHTVGGAALGALTGVLVGAISGGKKVGQDAIVGAVAGGFLAFAYAWGACFAAYTKVTSEQAKGFKETRTEIGYKAKQGTVTKIRDYTIDPAAIAPGDKPTLNASYYIMTPQDKEITVTETLTLKIYNPEKKIFEEVGSTSETIVMKPGKRKATSEIPIPPNAEEGKFFIVFKITTQEQTDKMEMPLTITKNQEILAKAKKESSRRLAKAEKQASTSVNPSAERTKADYAAETGSKDVAVSNDKQVLVTTEKANLRENPDVHSKVVAKASKAEQYILLNTVTIAGKQWHQIRLGDGKTVAWIYASLCKVVE